VGESHQGSGDSSAVTAQTSDADGDTASHGIAALQRCGVAACFERMHAPQLKLAIRQKQ
jgi:hypothetical protein